MKRLSKTKINNVSYNYILERCILIKLLYANTGEIYPDRSRTV